MYNQDLFDRYLDDHVWVGELFVDDGWGDKTKVVNSLCKYSYAVLESAVEQNIEETLFLASPTVEHVKMHVPNCQNPSFRSINQRYNVAFINHNFDSFQKTIASIESVCSDKFQLVLKAFNVEDKKLTGGKILLVISKEKDLDINYKLVEGRAAIIYDRPRVLAEWVEDNNINGALNG